MKKASLILLLTAASFAGFSQGVSFGIKAGANFAKEKVSLSGANLSSDTYTNLLAGVYLKAMITDKVGVQPELLYSLQGGKSDDGNGGTTTTKTAYVNIPLLVRYQVVPVFNLHTGPQVGVLLSAKNDGTDIKSQYNSADFGWVFGAGIDLPMGLNFSGRYVLGLGNIAKSDPTAPDLKVTNQVFQLAVGFKLFGK